jgi:hypothetical protein
VGKRQRKELLMSEDIIGLLEDYIPADNRKKWAKLASTVDSRRLELLLLKEILLELRRVREAVQNHRI